MKEQIFIGGAWPYANNSLHVGHLAALLPGDILARYYRQKGAEVMYVSGSDCHGTPITVRAKKLNISPEKIAEHYNQEFKNTFDALSFSYDLYTATMTPYHKVHVQEFVKQIDKNGYIYEKEEDEPYCEHCKTFLSDRELVGTCPVCGAETNGDQCDHCLTSLSANMVLNPRCKVCGQSATMHKNKHLYFALSRLSKQVQEFVDKNKDHWRQTAVNESTKYLKEGLRDRALTRQLDWGVEIPFPGFEDKRMYVWFEAVLGYFTAGEKVMEEKGEDFWKFITDKNTKCYYVHGKDNIVFHTIILPGLLEALNPQIQKPDYIISSEYVNLNNDKMSKSKGNLVTVKTLLANFDSESIRYYFMFNNPERRDTSFSIEDYVDIHNKHLVGGYGNFVNRNLSFLAKKFDGVLPAIDVSDEVRATVKNAYKTIGDLIEKGENRTAVEEMYSLIKYANKYYDESAPWTLYENDKPAFDKVTSNCLYLIANIANITAPLLPKTAAKVKEFLGITGEEKWDEIFYNPNKKLENITVLFNRVALKDVDLSLQDKDEFNC